MDILRKEGLPKKTTQFRSLKDSLASAINLRSPMIAQMHGYPRPRQIVARVYEKLAKGDLNEIKSAIIKLRDCAELAYHVIVKVPGLDIKRYALTVTDVVNYLTDERDEYSRATFDDDDRHFIAHLITTMELQTTSWSLDLSPAQDKNILMQFLKMYQQTCQADHKNNISFKKDKLVLPEANKDVPLYYDPSSNKLVPLTSLVYSEDVAREISREYKSKTAQDKSKFELDQNAIFESEKTIYAITDIILLDHLLRLFMDPNIWLTFITPRTKKDDEGQAIERGKGLRTFATYLNSLLMYPHIFRYELFKYSYESIEAWHGSFPIVPAHVAANYEKYIRNYDVFDAQKDVRDIAQKYSTSNDPNLHTAISVQFTELTNAFGISEVISSLNKKNIPARINLIDANQLKGPEYAHLINSYPLKEVPLLDKVLVRIQQQELFKKITMESITLISSGHTHYTDESLDRLKRLAFRTNIPLHGYLANSPSVSRAAMPAYKMGKFPIRYKAAWHTTANDYALRRKELFTFDTASALVSKYIGNVGYDETAAEKVRASLGRQWKCFYPANLINGEMYVTKDRYIHTTTDMESFFELISENFYGNISARIKNDPERKIWASYLSSCALIYSMTTDGKMELIPGVGKPYGVDWTKLNEMQNFEKTDFVKIPDTEFYIAFLKEVPTPSNSIDMDHLFFDEPYYFCPGNGSTMQVSALTLGESMLHYGLRLVKPLANDQGILFDKKWIYDNDSFYQQLSAAARFNSDPDTDEIVTIPLTKSEWKGERTEMFIEYIHFGPYGTGSSSSIGQSSSESAAGDAAVTAMLKNAEKEMKALQADNVVTNLAPEPKDLLEESKVAEQVLKEEPTLTKSTGDGKSAAKNASAPSKENLSAIGHFDVDGKIVEVVPKKGESDDDAISRVGKTHKKEPSDFIRK